MRKTLLFTLLSLVYCNVYGQKKPNKLDQPFHQLLKEVDATFVMPEGFAETHINKNISVFYQYAIKEPQSGFEVRYYLYPYKGNKQREKLVYNLFLTTIINAMGENAKSPDIQIQDSKDIAHDFNGDWGANAVFQPGGGFGKGFQFCSAQAIQKRGVGEVYIFWLFTDVEKQEQLMQATFKTISFVP